MDAQIFLHIVVIGHLKGGRYHKSGLVGGTLGEDGGDFGFGEGEAGAGDGVPPFTRARRHERTLHLNETCGAELRGLVGALRSRLRDGAVGGNRLAPYLESVHE